VFQPEDRLLVIKHEEPLLDISMRRIDHMDRFRVDDRVEDSLIVVAFTEILEMLVDLVLRGELVILGIWLFLSAHGKQ
jgi:hypothetical protein